MTLQVQGTRRQVYRFFTFFFQLSNSFMLLFLSWIEGVCRELDFATFQVYVNTSHSIQANFCKKKIVQIKDEIWNTHRLGEQDIDVELHSKRI